LCCSVLFLAGKRRDHPSIHPRAAVVIKLWKKWHFVRPRKSRFFRRFLPLCRPKDESAVSPLVVRDLHAWLTVTFQITDCRIIWLIKNASAFSAAAAHTRKIVSCISSLEPAALFAAFLWFMRSSICHSGRGAREYTDNDILRARTNIGIVSAHSNFLQLFLNL
jgi:hypothetical protein